MAASLIAVSACSANIRLGQGDDRAQAQAAQATEALVIEREIERECMARAAHFRGLVPRPCEEIARETRP